MRRAVIIFTAVLGFLFTSLGLGATSALAEGESLQGTLINAGQPVAGVVIKVAEESGTPVGEATSDAQGKWSVSVPAAGTYKVDLDAATLPQGVAVTTGRTSLTLSVFEGAARNVLFPLGAAAGSPGADQPAEGGTSQLERVADLVYTGIHFGLIIALAALGLSLIFGTMGLTNFAHGELITFGAVACFFINVTASVPLEIAAVLAVALGGLFGYFQDRFFWGWLRNRRTGLIGMMIISIGLALILRYLFLYVFRGDTRQFAQYVAQPGMDLGLISVAPKNLVMDGIAIIVLIVVSLALVKTRLGKATRAVSTNPSLAAASGISVDSVIRLVWTIGGALAALSGVMLAIFQGVNYQMGFQILLLVFAAVTLGGLGTAFGALLGSLVIGLATQLSTLWIPTELKNVGALAVLIVIILVRPQGILGRRERIG
ncbi:branched-chain amino acid transport system permease protein [Actinoplanes lutulentus]|uniref:Amino acid/amide ABC transporter membrane protein 1 (HAAT family) n=1 Tax=Actinoplanes lutulentus TaxID=1287878 RepID=A0A327ZGB5_9ACTN|nr:branched-chain amino acid ABC transporter permease [Actinoplanes lutulentus]MBB2941549.1 branched-chain amino acid transport system permease protein [Actinoplanes lutulentus]RAK39469.1 amino acid/amide ABC transporter membrane protein 1 (HAAT family) [Actinoplanes lutulentus]